jgi:hypothetical protein
LNERWLPGIIMPYGGVVSGASLSSEDFIVFLAQGTLEELVCLQSLLLG